MGSCKICNRNNVDTISGVCGACIGRNRKKERQTRSVIKISIIAVISLIGIYGLSTFLTSDLGINLVKDTSSKLDEVKSTVQKEIPKVPEMVSQKANEVKQAIENKSSSVSESLKPQPIPTLDELKQIALDDINKYRSQNKLNQITLGTAKSSQLYAKELLEERCIHHISVSGEGPMLRYKNNGDTMYLVAENIASGYDSGGISPQSHITKSNYDMMFDDAESNWGHRDNILTPDHQSVSIGIAFDKNNFVMVQDFEQVLKPGYVYDPSSFSQEPVDSKHCW